MKIVLKFKQTLKNCLNWKKKLTLTDYEIYPAWQSNPSSLVSSTMDCQILWRTWNLEKKIKLKSSKIEDCAKIETDFEKLSKWEKKRNLLWQTMKCTGKFLTEALIFASTNPQYDDWLFIELQVQYMKILSSNLRRKCCVQKLFLTFRTILVHNMFCRCCELLKKFYLYHCALEIILHWIEF